MKKFNFKLKNVLKYRETLESMAKNAYSEALALLNREKENLKMLEDKRTALKLSYNVRAGAVIDANNLTMAANYMSQLLYLIQKQQTVIAQKEKIAKERLQDWNKKRMEVKVIRKLEEKQYNLYQKEMEKEEQKFQDEIFIAKKVALAKEQQ